MNIELYIFILHGEMGPWDGRPWDFKNRKHFLIIKTTKDDLLFFF